jgi:hypothetical protein
MHLVNAYASDLLTWQKDAKTFVQQWRINLPYSAERIEATSRMDRDHLFLSFQWVRIMTLFSAHEEIPTKDKHNNPTPGGGLSGMLAHTSRFFFFCWACLQSCFLAAAPRGRNSTSHRAIVISNRSS